jgi:hypothetical protein
VWQANEDDSRSRDWDRVYERTYQEDWQPEYDYDFTIPDTIRAHMEAGNITDDEFTREVESSLDSSGMRYSSVDVYSDIVYIYGLDRDGYEELESARWWDDSLWDYYIEELNDEYGDPYEEDDEDDDIDEALNDNTSNNDAQPAKYFAVMENNWAEDYFDTEDEAIEFAKKHGYDSVQEICIHNEGTDEENTEFCDIVWTKDDLDEALESPEFKKGDKVKYHGKVTTIMDVENDPEFGVDYLIVNPNYDGTDARYENIWVGDRVDPV